jgi:uncharacterized membrane protein
VVTAYEFFLWVHITCAVIWVGADITIQAFAFRILRANDPARAAAFTKDVEWMGLRLITPASLLLVIFGFLLMHEGHWSYDFWVIFGIVVWALSAVVGGAFLGPEAGRIGKLVEERGPEDPEVQARIRRILAFSRIELVLLLAVVFDMTVKPFL